MCVYRDGAWLAQWSGDRLQSRRQVDRSLSTPLTHATDVNIAISVAALQGSVLELAGPVSVHYDWVR